VILLRGNRVVATFCGNTVLHPMSTRLKTLRQTMLVVSVQPVAARGRLYAFADHQRSWREANWSRHGRTTRR